MGKYTLITSLCAWVLTNTALAQHINYYEILDAMEANKLFSALKTDSTSVPGWPLPQERRTANELMLNLNNFAEVERISLTENSTLIKIKIREIDLRGAKLRGMVPAVRLDSLEYLRLGFNAITGIVSGVELPNLRVLELDRCQLTAFPALNFPRLTTVDLDANLMKGPLPEINFLDLDYLDAGENQLTGRLVVNAPKLRTLDLGDNQLSGDLTQLNAPALKNLFLDNNQFKGLLSIPTFPSLEWLGLSSNEYDEIAPNFITSIPAIRILSLDYNHFLFDDLEPLADLEIDDFSYSSQYPVPLKIEGEITSQRLTAETAGENLKYQWLYILPESPLRQINQDSLWLYLSLYISWASTQDWDQLGVRILDSIQGNELQIPISHNPRHYACQVTSPILPDLRLAVVSLQSSSVKCWENSFFTFCFESEEASWESGDEENEIKATKPLTINNFIHFEGNLILDTVNLSMKSDGKFYIQDIPIPGGGVGDFTVAEGVYELVLGGEDGKITGFINDALSRFTPDIGGLELKLEEIALVGGRNADGISMILEVSWDNITPSCGSSRDQTTAVKLEGLKITRLEGIDVEGLQVSDLGLAPGFCVKELGASYHADDDKLTFGLTLLTPFIEVGGGLGLVGGEIDSIAMRAVLQDAIIPLGTTGVGLIGCEGRVSSITNPPFNIRFGGILSAVANDRLFQITTSLEYIPPSELKIEAGDGKLFNPPFYDDDWWLAEGGIYGQIDLSTYRVKVGGDLHLSPYEDDAGEKKFMANGITELAYRNGIFIGQLQGDVMIPELGKDWPYDWLNARLGLPYEFGGSALLVYKSTAKYISGDVNLGDRIGMVHYDINLSKRYDEEGFFSFQAKEINTSSPMRSIQDFVIDIPENTPLMVIRLAGYTGESMATLEDPQKGNYFPFQTGDDNDWDYDDIRQTGFWSIYKPEPGTWNLSVNRTDSVSWYLFAEPYDFQITASSGQDGISVMWDPSIYEPGDSIDLFVDTDTTGFDGIFVQQVEALTGNHLIPRQLLPPQCSFYVFGISTRHGFIRSDYADQRVDMDNSGLVAPGEVTWSYDATNQELVLDWAIPNDPEVVGYVVERWLNEGKEVLAMLYPEETHFTVNLSSFSPDQIRIVSYGDNGETSCPLLLESSTFVESIDDESQVVNRFQLFPNPASNHCTISFESMGSASVRIQVANLLGEVVKEKELLVHEGVNHINLELHGWSTGHYLVRLLGNHNIKPEILFVQQ